MPDYDLSGRGLHPMPWRLGTVSAVGFLAGVLVAAAGSADAAPAVLDPSFGGGWGMVTTSFASSAAADAVVLQPDGKIVAVGGVGQPFTSRDFALARYEPDGTLDPTFGSGGVVTAPAGIARAVALQPDGKIVAAGTTFTQVRIARYHADGSLDPSFGTGGVVTTQVGTGDSGANALLLQPDGKIVVAGEGSDGQNTEFMLVRYDAHGSLDPTFGSVGVVMSQIGAGDSAIEGLALQADGKLIADGEGSDGSKTKLALVRYDAHGSLDPTFGTGGVVTAPFLYDPSNASVGPVTLQADGKIVSARTDSGIWVVARYDTKGSLDPTFGDRGVAILGAYYYGRASSMALQPDGKIVLAGSSSDGGTDTANLLELARWNSNGTLDGTTFSGSGFAFFHAWRGSTANPPPPASPAIALQPDGRIVAAGSASDDAGTTQRFLLARYGASTVTVNFVNQAGPNKGTGGEIASAPAGIDCAADLSCFYPPDHFIWQHAFPAGPVTLTATPWQGYLFAGWSDGCSGTGTCQVQVSGDVSDDQSVTATFVPAPTKPLTVTKAGTGAGSITTSGLYCPVGRRHRCSADFVVGSKVTLKAQPTSDWSTFTGWSGDCNGKGTCTVIMNGNHVVTGTFQHFCIVPRVKGERLRRARLSARKAHCSLGTVKLVFSTLQRGRVVAQKPAPGRRLLGRSRLRLEISKGP
jgi:uncharacterized delta-60 repeat protein